MPHTDNHEKPVGKALMADAMTQMMQQLRGERDRFVAFAFANADILLEVDPKGQILFADGATFGLTGKRPEDIIGANLTHYLTEEDIAPTLQLLSTTTESNRIDNVIIHMHSEGGAAVPLVLSGYKLPYMQQRIYITLTLLKDAYKPEDVGRRSLQSGLLKQSAFEREANEKIEEAHAAGKDLTLTLLDIPELQALLKKDDSGEAKKLLDDICQYLKAHSLDGDSAGDMEGGKFGLLHDNSENPQTLLSDMQNMARKRRLPEENLDMRIHAVTMEPMELSGEDRGRALHYTINKFAEDSGGEFCITSLEESYAGMLDDTLQKIASFRQTVGDNAFNIAMQPIVDIANEKVHHYEVLVRLKNETFDNPFHFVTFGEQAGIIGEFDLAMFQRIIDLLEESAAIGKRPVVAINFSGLSLSSAIFRDAVKQMLEEHDGIRKQMIIEVTESAKIKDLQMANQFLQQLRKGGNLCCLDDFGVAESSFDYLRCLEVDFVKIDGSYVKDSLATTRGQHMLKAMVDLCHQLQIVTIGEMVEDAHIADFLKSCKVSFGQGYYYGKPTTDIDELIRTMPKLPLPSTTIPRRKASKAKSWMQAINTQVN